MFGEIKSKIETYLVESYKENRFKSSLFVFEELVLKNKNISKIFFLYDELKDQKGLNESVANEFIHESITAYENLINKVKPVHIQELNAWVGHVVCENKYQEIDNLFSTNVLTLENKIKSKKVILENLKTKKEDQKEIIKVPLKSMVNVANKTIDKYIAIFNGIRTKRIENYFVKTEGNLD
jgi:hypothetical protein